MRHVPRARLKLRRLLRSRAKRMPLRPSIARVLGYRWRGDTIIDSLPVTPIEYDPTSDIGGSLFTTGAFEESDIRFIEALLRPLAQPTVLDIGANVGLHSIRWMRAAPEGQCFAFEPSRTTVELLRRNVELNDLTERVEVLQEALSDEGGTATFFHCSDDAYSSLRDTRRKRVTTTYPVAVTTVDTFVDERGLSQVDLIKIDVEGFEGHVLKGAAHTLLTLRPHLFVEVYGGEASNPDPEGTVEFVIAHGYRASVLEEGLPTPYVRHSDRRYNYYFEPI